MSHSFLITTLHPSLFTHLIQPPPPLSFLLCIPLSCLSPLLSHPASLLLCLLLLCHFPSFKLSSPLPFSLCFSSAVFPLLSSPPPAPSLLFSSSLLPPPSCHLLLYPTSPPHIHLFYLFFPPPSYPRHTVPCSPLLSPLVPATLPPPPACVTYILMSSYLLSSHRPHFLLGSTSAPIFETTLPLSVHAHMSSAPLFTAIVRLSSDAQFPHPSLMSSYFFLLMAYLAFLFL